MRDRAELRASPDADAPVVGFAKKGATYKVTARAGDSLRVETGQKRFGWIAASATKQAGPAAALGLALPDLDQ